MPPRDDVTTHQELPYPKASKGTVEAAPWDWRTIPFALIMGILGSVLVNILVPDEYHFLQDDSGRLRVLYAQSVFVAFVLLPLWSLFALRPYPTVRSLGLVAFLIMLLFAVPIALP